MVRTWLGVTSHVVDAAPFVTLLPYSRRGKRLLKIHACCPVILRFPRSKRFKDTPVFDSLERRTSLSLGGRAIGLQHSVFRYRIIERSAWWVEG